MLVIYFERKDLPGEINMKRSARIVGVRRCIQLDKLKVSELTVNFIADNKTIVSGMSKEIDSYAHLHFPFYISPIYDKIMYTCITKAHGRYTS